MDASIKAGIVSTHRSWTSESEAWARYHLSLGFSKLYVFADDGCAYRLPSDLAVELTPCTQAHWASQRPTRGFGGFLCDLEQDFGTARWGCAERLTQRQILNACAALDRAAADGVDWLLHIDDDEYFWCGHACIHEHFDGLHHAGIGRVLYLNHEAVVLDERACQTRPRAFKKNWQALTLAQQRAVPSALPDKPYFVSHSGGRSAVRVTAGTVPLDVHMFHVPDLMLGQSVSRCPGVLHLPRNSASGSCEKHRWSEAERDRLEAEGCLLVPRAPLPIDHHREAA